MSEPSNNGNNRPRTTTTNDRKEKEDKNARRKAVAGAPLHSFPAGWEGVKLRSDRPRRRLARRRAASGAHLASGARIAVAPCSRRRGRNQARRRKCLRTKVSIANGGRNFSWCAGRHGKARIQIPNEPRETRLTF